MELLIVTSIQQKLEESNKLLQDKNKNSTHLHLKINTR